MSNPNSGEIWLVNFPFSDLTSTKVRPAFVLATHRQDVIILGIFSKIPAGNLADSWVLVEDSHPEFSPTGLKKSSLLRADKIATVHESVFQKQLGTLPNDMVSLVYTALRKALHF
ncbi:MAG: type II toxin-antitoxin system PemK/MazF family toxin [Oculatellaceae cyanobacterium bins.114]|nr:type II toxin-antitoxin system PemK/MazF family toxin [Oculatellaceae cyanobacterium bins.114]